MRRDQHQVTVLTSSTLLLTPNEGRVGLVLSSPTPLITSAGQASVFASAVDTSTAGVKLTFTAPSTREATLWSATMTETTGAGVVADLELVRSAVVTKLGRVTTAGVLSIDMPLAVNDVVRWNVITPIGASVTDFSIGASNLVTSNRITVSINNPAVDGQGILLYPGQAPLVLTEKLIGDALVGDLFAIALTASQPMAVWDFFR